MRRTQLRAPIVARFTSPGTHAGEARAHGGLVRPSPARDCLGERATCTDSLVRGPRPQRSCSFLLPVRCRRAAVRRMRRRGGGPSQSISHRERKNGQRTTENATQPKTSTRARAPARSTNHPMFGVRLRVNGACLRLPFLAFSVLRCRLFRFIVTDGLRRVVAEHSLSQAPLANPRAARHCAPMPRAGSTVARAFALAPRNHARVF
jgi:hypothetical protein